MWLRSDICESAAAEADMVVISYAFGRIGDEQVDPRSSSLGTTKQMLVVIGPGTPVDFRTILDARTQLLEIGRARAGAMPHETACPMADGKRLVPLLSATGENV